MLSEAKHLGLIGLWHECLEEISDFFSRHCGIRMTKHAA
jgi:hypothetical protein